MELTPTPQDLDVVETKQRRAVIIEKFKPFLDTLRELGSDNDVNSVEESSYLWWLVKEYEEIGISLEVCVTHEHQDADSDAFPNSDTYSLITRFVDNDGSSSSDAIIALEWFTDTNRNQLEVRGVHGLSEVMIDLNDTEIDPQTLDQVFQLYSGLIEPIAR